MACKVPSGDVYSCHWPTRFFLFEKNKIPPSYVVGCRVDTFPLRLVIRPRHVLDPPSDRAAASRGRQRDPCFGCVPQCSPLAHGATENLAPICSLWGQRYIIFNHILEDDTIAKQFYICLCQEYFFRNLSGKNLRQPIYSKESLAFIFSLFKLTWLMLILG